MTNTATGLAPYAGPLALACLVVNLILIATVLWLAIRLKRVERRYTALLHGTDGGNLQTVLEDHIAEVRTALTEAQTMTQRTDQLAQEACSYVQHIGLVRYNPFRDTGGDQSFALALADGHGNGAILTSLHMRDVTRVYAKPLENWSSAYPLTDEEEHALRVARDTTAA